MSLSADQQKRLDPVLAGLREIPGVSEVASDDFDSRSIIVFMTLTVKTRHGCMTSNKRPYRFYKGIRSIKAAIKRVCQPHPDRCRGFNFLDWPTKMYISDGCGGRLDNGYTHENIKIEVSV